MEHIIQLSVSVDDDRIMELAEVAAAKELVKEFKADDYGYSYRSIWKEKLQREAVEKIVEEISLDALAENVAAKLARSLKFREKVEKKIGGGE